MDTKVVLITGASSGIGAGIATHLAAAGYKRLALVARRADLLEEVAQKCRDNGASQVECIRKDLLLEGGCREAVQETVDKLAGGFKYRHVQITSSVANVQADSVQRDAN